ncbi:heme-binding protein [Lysobacter sp. LF1]|uniref:Heme-binding protein n=1 Tax=Lysobacter stagni TaxID=3045172 RepID=A0ABT6XET4_9GAMM|nr:heme-binding protein [Lysobacter sp. LF1]MDI9238645.1 heme-binding protein [Lysobacter sp. LF1]
MNASSSPLFTDTLKSIPGFFGIRFDAKPAYHIEDIVGKVEIRRYAPSWLAQVSADGSHDAAVALAHEKLADYVCGGNESREKMGMTSPSFEVEGESKMFPVSLSRRDESSRQEELDGWRVAFFISNCLSAREVPLPDDPAIQIRQTPETLVATLRYRGGNTEERRSLAKRELIEALSGSKWTADDQVYWASYDQAFVIPYLTRNEVHVRVLRFPVRSAASPKRRDELVNPAVPYRVDFALAPACDDEVALQRAENEGMPPNLMFEKTSARLFPRVSRYVRSRSTTSPELSRTLEELLCDLKAATQGDAQLRRRSASLIALMASDIRDAKHFSIESSLGARPMRAWRQRYNGIGVL